MHTTPVLSLALCLASAPALAQYAPGGFAPRLQFNASSGQYPQLNGAGGVAYPSGGGVGASTGVGLNDALIGRQTGLAQPGGGMVGGVPGAMTPSSAYSTGGGAAGFATTPNTGALYNAPYSAPGWNASGVIWPYGGNGYYAPSYAPPYGSRSLRQP
jgi:hypothetical protein